MVRIDAEKNFDPLAGDERQYGHTGRERSQADLYPKSELRITHPIPPRVEVDFTPSDLTIATANETVDFGAMNIRGFHRPLPQLAIQAGIS
jgi:hypothetical protein